MYSVPAEKKESGFTFSVLSKEGWKDLELLFGNNGACGGCWCMTPRLSTSEYKKNKGDKNKELFHQLLLKNEPLGVLAYYNKNPIAWCSISPKSRLKEMKISRIMNHTSDENTWSIVCLFIKKEFRRKQISTFIIDKAVEYAFKNGATTVEAYPVVTMKDKMPDVFAWAGIWKSYEKAGFKIVRQVSATKLIMARSN